MKSLHSIVSFSLPRRLYLLAFVHSLLSVWIATFYLHHNGFEPYLFMGSCKKLSKKVLYTLHPIVLNRNISCSHSTIEEPGNGHWHHSQTLSKYLFMVLYVCYACVVLSCVDSCNYNRS